MPVDGGEATRVLEGVPAADTWVILEKGIVFLDNDKGPARIKFFDFATRRAREITSVDLGPGAPAGKMFSISPDGKWILFSRVDQFESDIMLVENFR